MRGTLVAASDRFSVPAHQASALQAPFPFTLPNPRSGSQGVMLGPSLRSAQASMGQTGVRCQSEVAQTPDLWIPQRKRDTYSSTQNPASRCGTEKEILN
jgi:hypothetical protein